MKTRIVSRALPAVVVAILRVPLRAEEACTDPDSGNPGGFVALRGQAEVTRSRPGRLLIVSGPTGH